MKSPPLSRLPLLPVLGAAALALPAAAQTTKLISTGDVVPGLGTVTSVHEFDVNEAGDWIANVRAASTGSSTALVRNGVLVLQPGDALPGAPGSSFANATRLSLADVGQDAWVANGVAQPNFGAYSGVVPFLVQGDPITGAGIAPGTVCTRVFNCVLEPTGTMIVSAWMNGQFGSNTRVLARAAAHGSGLTATSILKAGDVLPGHASPVVQFSLAPHTLASNTSGQVLYAVQFSSATSGIYLDTQKLALEGATSPVFGSNWASLEDRPVALNDAGDYAFSGRIYALAGHADLLVWNGIIVARQGESLPAIAPHSITTLSGENPTLAAPIRLAQDGRVLWYAAWDDPDSTRNSGLFLDHELIAQEGVTLVNGVPIDEFGGGALGAADFEISADGTEVFVRARLANGEIGVYAIRPEGGVSSVPGCVPNAGRIDAFDPPTLGDGLFISMDQAQAEGALAVLFVSTEAITTSATCGIALPGVGEILIDFAAPNPILVRPGLFPATSATANPPLGTVVLVGGVPNSPSLFGKTIYAQGLWIDADHSVEPLRLTNALALSIGL